MPDEKYPDEEHSKILEQLDANDGVFTSFGEYMNAKVAKLQHQVHSGVTPKTGLFKGLSFYVNGYTDPPALVLKNLIVQNGGEYHHYYHYGKTTHMIATSLSKIKKWRTLRDNEKVIKPRWIVKCLEKGQLVPEDEFLFLIPTMAGACSQKLIVLVSCSSTVILVCISYLLWLRI
uniref:BRCT domain-containing protein n=1 Tax=Ditylenchus dipsaci TaxID=166011 RepID=A0A915E969_9BILA